MDDQSCLWVAFFLHRDLDSSRPYSRDWSAQLILSQQPPPQGSHPMSRFRFRDEESSSTGTIVGVLAGAVAGFAVGMLVAQRVGGFSGLINGITSRIRRRGAAPAEASPRSPYDTAGEVDDFDDVGDDDFEAEDYDSSLEERVLEAYRNDPILSERAVDIGSIGEGVIELAGWVED